MGKRAEAEAEAEEKEQTGAGRYGTAPALTAHKGRSKPAERKDGMTVLDGVTKACQAVITKFIGNPNLIKNETDVPKLVRAEGSNDIDKATPDSVIINRFRNILCSRPLPKYAKKKWEEVKKNRPKELLNKKERRALRRLEAKQGAGGGTEVNNGGSDKKKKRSHESEEEEEEEEEVMKVHTPKKPTLNVSKTGDLGVAAKSGFDLHASR